MKLRQYQVDAFASRAFEGNPAAVCPLQAWLDDSLLQAIAEENNLSETAFFVPSGEGYALRWFTPAAEVDLCGHATLASAHVLFDALDHPGGSVSFYTRSGTLTVERRNGMLAMDFPAIPLAECAAPDALIAGLGRTPAEVLAGTDYVAVFDSEDDVRSITPDLARLRELDLRGVVVTAPGVDHDFVSRFFAPGVGVPEDPVTGSAHCELAPYWAQRLGRDTLAARQVSRRGGDVHCELRGERVVISGPAVTFMEAVIRVDA